MLTVAMPVYNRQGFLAGSIESILRQTYQDFEFLILDDASSDNSLQILKKYQKKDKRIKILQNKKNQGEAYCRNLLIEKANGKYLAWMDSDDISPSYRLFKQYKFLEKKPYIDILGGQAMMFGGKNKFTYCPLKNHSIQSHMLSICGVITPALMMRLEKIKKLGLKFQNNIRIAPDFDFYTRFCEKLKFANLVNIIYFYRSHTNQLTSPKNQSQYDNTYQVAIQRHLKNFNILAEKRTIETFFPFLSPLKNIKEKEELTKLTQQILAIKNFYGYSKIHPEIKHKLLAALYYQYYRFYKKEKKIITFFFCYGFLAFYSVFRIKISKFFIIFYSILLSLPFLPQQMRYL